MNYDGIKEDDAELNRRCMRCRCNVKTRRARDKRSQGKGNGRKGISESIETSECRKGSCSVAHEVNAGEILE